MVHIKFTRRPRRRRFPAATTPTVWREGTFVVIDLETTGLDPRRDHIVSYGAVPVRAGRVRVAESVYGLVRAPCKVPPSATKCHAIRTEDVTDAPPLSDCVQRLRTLMHDHVLVAHGAWIERTFLRRAFRDNYLSFDNPIVDTAQLATPFLDLDPSPGALVSLEYAAAALRLPVHSPHHALGDALTTAGLFITLAGRLESQGPLTTSTLLALSTT